MNERIDNSSASTKKQEPFLSGREVKLNLQVNLQRKLNENFERYGKAGLKYDFAKITLAYSDTEVIIAIGGTDDLHVAILSKYLIKADRQKWILLAELDSEKRTLELLKSYTISGGALAFDEINSLITITGKSKHFGQIPIEIQSEIQGLLNNSSMKKPTSPAEVNNADFDSQLNTSAFNPT